MTDEISRYHAASMESTTFEEQPSIMSLMLPQYFLVGMVGSSVLLFWYHDNCGRYETGYWSIARIFTGNVSSNQITRNFIYLRLIVHLSNRLNIAQIIVVFCAKLQKDLKATVARAVRTEHDFSRFDFKTASGEILYNNSQRGSIVQILLEIAKLISVVHINMFPDMLYINIRFIWRWHQSSKVSSRLNARSS